MIDMIKRKNGSASAISTPVVYTNGERTQGEFKGTIDGTLFYGDCLKFLKDVDKNGNRYIADGSVDLIYIDPPFNSNRVYNVIYREPDGKESAAQIKGFEDSWTWCDDVARQFWDLTKKPGKVAEAIIGLRQILGDSNMAAYLVMMCSRLVEMKRVLKSTGSIYYHCDSTASHYIKVLMDAIFGVDNFISEIVWKRKNNSATITSNTRSFGANHDVILLYTKSDNYVFKRLTVNIKVNPADYPKDSQGYYKTAPAGNYSDDSLNKMLDEGRAYRTSGGLVRKKNYLSVINKELYDVRVVDNLWMDIPNMMHVPLAERLGYPTQKPEALLERIIQASSNEGDLVLDCFCGCGTTIAVANRLKRRWIGIDITHLALNLMRHRLGPNATYKVIGAPEDLAGAKQLALEDKMQFQHWALGLDNAMSLEGVKRGADQGIDGKRFFFVPNPDRNESIIYSVKGGAVSSRDVRDLIGTVSNNKAAIGVLITLEPITKDMRSEAAKAGFYKPNDFAENKFPKIQVYSVEELLAGKRVEWPQYLKDTTLPEVKVDTTKPDSGHNAKIDDL